MYVRSRGLGTLGQTATTQFVAGQTVSLTFSVSLGAASVFQGLELGAGLGDIQQTLAEWAPFANGNFTNLSVAFDNPVLPTVLTVTFTVGQGGTQYEYGLLAQSIATEINTGIPWGSVQPLGLGPGLGSPSVAGSVAQSWTLNPVTLAQEDLNLLTGGSLTPTGSTPLPGWVWAAGIGALLLGVAYSVS